MSLLDIWPKIVLDIEFCQPCLQLLLGHIKFSTSIQTKEELEDGHSLGLKLLHEFTSGLELFVSFLTEFSQSSL